MHWYKICVNNLRMILKAVGAPPVVLLTAEDIREVFDPKLFPLLPIEFCTNIRTSIFWKKKVKQKQFNDETLYYLAWHALFIE